MDLLSAAELGLASALAERHLNLPCGSRRTVDCPTGRRCERTRTSDQYRALARKLRGRGPCGRVCIRMLTQTSRRSRYCRYYFLEPLVYAMLNALHVTPLHASCIR